MENKQLVIKQFSDSILEATEIVKSAMPVLQAGEVLIKNNFVGINAIYDREMYQGKVPYIDVQFPYVFGVESLGTIIEVGPGMDKKWIGQVASMNKVGTAYQEFQAAKVDAFKIVPALDPAYLTLHPTGLSAYLAIEQLTAIKARQIVVIDAAAGGLGHLLVQLCKAKGAEVIAICGAQRKVEFLAGLNCCDRIINYRQDNLEQIIDQEYGNRIDWAFDSVGGPMFDLLVKNLNQRGQLILIGLAAELSQPAFEIITSPRIYKSMYWKGASIRCFMNHLYKDLHAAALETLIEQYHAGSLQVCVDQTSFQGIASIPAASQYLLDGKSMGKVVVEL